MNKIKLKIAHQDKRGKIIDILDDDILVVEISKGVNIKIKRDFVNSLVDNEEKK